MLHVAIGHAKDIDPLAALSSAIDACRVQLDGREPKAGVFFTSCMAADFQRMLDMIEDAFPGLDLIGCTTDGETSTDIGFEDESTALLLFASDTISIASGLGLSISQDPFAAAQSAYSHARKKLGCEPVLGIALPDGLSALGKPLDAALRAAAGQENFVWAGGTAGDNFFLEKTWQFHNGLVHHDSLPVLLFGGELQCSVSLASGWKPIGQQYNVHKIDDNTLSSIGDMPALDFYEHYLGYNTKEYTQFPLAVKAKGMDGFTLRDPLVFDENKRAIAFVGPFPDDATVQLTEVGREDIIQAAAEASRAALASYPGEKPALALIFSCASRRQLLGTRTHEEIKAFHSALGDPVPVFGFYTYGEIAPFQAGQATQYHNDTFVVVLLGQ